jgi:hypothetical protein
VGAKDEWLRATLFYEVREVIVTVRVRFYAGHVAGPLIAVSPECGVWFQRCGSNHLRGCRRDRCHAFGIADVAVLVASVLGREHGVAAST